MANVTAHKRLLKEIQMLTAAPLDFAEVKADEKNLLAWYFILNGSPSTAYEGGKYMGSLHFPPQYPFKAPTIKLHTPNGRFTPKQTLCISGISHYHPETWNPLWTIATILRALVSFMNEESLGIGSIRETPSVRRQLALESQAWNERNEIYVRYFASPTMKDES